jgi:hypothetical protein
MRAQPLIAVKDVEASSQWYQRLLGFQSAHGGLEYERLVSNGVLVLQLHSWDVDHHHGPIGDPGAKPYGNGLLLWFEIDAFDAAIARAARMKAKVVKARHGTRLRAMAVRTTGSAGCEISMATRSCWPAAPLDSFKKLLTPAAGAPSSPGKTRSPRARGCRPG